MKKLISMEQVDVTKGTVRYSPVGDPPIGEEHPMRTAYITKSTFRGEKEFPRTVKITLEW